MVVKIVKIAPGPLFKKEESKGSRNYFPIVKEYVYEDVYNHRHNKKVSWKSFHGSVAASAAIIRLFDF